MGVTVSNTELIEILQAIAATIEENKGHLNELDGAIGDGDHGMSMSIGWRAVAKALPDLAETDCGNILKKVGMTLVSAIGAAIGPLYGTGFMRAGQAVEGKTEINQEDLAKMMQAFSEGIMQRGKANVGDKTMVDTIHPASEKFIKSIGDGRDLFTALDDMVEAAEKGMKSTADLISKMGRSSRLGERTIGHQDAGATSSYLILKTFAEKVKAIKS